MRGRKSSYSSYGRKAPRSRAPLYVAGILLLIVGGFLAYKFLIPTPVEKAVNNLRFDASVTEAEQHAIKNAIEEQKTTYKGDITVSVETVLELDKPKHMLSIFVPVTNFNASRQQVEKDELKSLDIYINADLSENEHQAFAEALGLNKDHIPLRLDSLETIPDDLVTFIPYGQLRSDVKLLTFDGSYFLDNFTKGAVFRQVVFSGEDSAALNSLALYTPDSKENIMTVRQTGVTALTRLMMTRLRTVGTPLYFSEKIGSYLAAADITHVSNEVSFKQGCSYHNALFCSPPEMIETLKASGVDVVELTGNHNNDVGAVYNTESIELYHSLGWKTFGGGLNTEEAAKPALFEQKGTKLAMLGYNYPDSPNGGAIAGADKAGANSFDFGRIESDIKAAHDAGNFVIVDVQFWECYAYPDGYVEFPECDRPIPNQTEVFRKIIDLGADIMVGSSAHQPQTYEIYKGKPIYYGLGNLYFDQDRWPGTERGIILTHYLREGRLLQTKLDLTEYDSNYQTDFMSNDKAVRILDRLKTAREVSGLND